MPLAASKHMHGNAASPLPESASFASLTGSGKVNESRCGAPNPRERKGAACLGTQAFRLVRKRGAAAARSVE